MNLLHTQLLAKTVPCAAELYVCPGRSAVKGLEIPFSHMMGECLINRFLYEDPFESVSYTHLDVYKRQL